MCIKPQCTLVHDVVRLRSWTQQASYVNLRISLQTKAEQNAVLAILSKLWFVIPRLHDCRQAIHISTTFQLTLLTKNFDIVSLSNLLRF